MHPVVLLAELDRATGPLVVVVACTDWRVEGTGHRRAQTAELARLLVGEGGSAALPTLLLGDLNAHPGTPEIATLTRVAADGRTSPEAGRTLSRANPYVDPDHHLADQRIDYVFVRSGRPGHPPRRDRSRLAGTGPVDGLVPSDHFAVLADIAV